MTAVPHAVWFTGTVLPQMTALPQITASPHDMFKLIVLRGMMLTFGGVALGLLAAFSLSNVLAALLFEMSPRDPISFAGVALLFLVIAAVACWLPARAAMRVQPSSALRTE